MLLYNVNIIGTDGPQHIQVEQGKIKGITRQKDIFSTNLKEIHLEFENSIAFPGLINSHDHLDFNSFPRIGNRIYNNYADWGKDIHQQNKETIKAVLKIPRELRIQWGLYKNLLNGVTTVVNHGAKLKICDPFITVLQNNYSLHSVQFEKYWKLKLNNVFAKKRPYVIHAGEGTDPIAHKEINTLIKWNLLKKSLFAIHGVAMNEEQSTKFNALIWCPASNYFLLNTTADIQKLKTKTSILFGTDSTLTSDWNLWEHLRLARKTGMMTDEELFRSVTLKPAAMWGLENSGKIAASHTADIVIAKKKNEVNQFDALYKVNPEDILLILHKGAIRLFDESLFAQLSDSNFSIKNMCSVSINNTKKYVHGDLSGLMEEIKKY
jgi:cytosine/adenosine deaminase-related metal-dependent hydrolase